MLDHTLASWSALYADHAAVRTTIAFLHIGGLLFAGGLAIAADLATLRAGDPGQPTRAMQLRLLQQTHALVLTGLSAVTMSGLLLFAADVDTFLVSRLFWTKAGLVALLLINGALMQRRERQAARGEVSAWRQLRHAAVTSVLLWFLITLAGAALPNVA